MTLFDYSHILTDTVDKLSDNNSYGGLFHQHKDGEPLPSGKALEEIIDLCQGQYCFRDTSENPISTART